MNLPSEPPTAVDHELPEPLNQAQEFAAIVGNLLAPIHADISLAMGEIKSITRRVVALEIKAANHERRLKRLEENRKAPR